MAHGFATRGVPAAPPQRPSSAGASPSGATDDEPAERPASSDDLILSNQGFVMKIAGEYRNLGLPYEDLLNEGNVGLLEAARRFDPSRGTRFITYAIFWIRKSILKALSRHASLVHVPEYRVRQANAIRDTGRALSRTLGRQADREEIARAMSITIDKLDMILRARMKDLALDAKAGDTGDESALDRLADERWVSPEIGMIQVETERRLRVALRRLTTRQRTVIVRRFGLAGGREQTLAEVGARLGLSRERVRQIEFAATKRLRMAIVGRQRTSPAAQRAGHPGAPTRQRRAVGD